MKPKIVFKKDKNGKVSLKINDIELAGSISNVITSDDLISGTIKVEILVDEVVIENDYI